MANVMHKKDNVPVAMDMLLTMLDLASNAVYATRKHMDNPYDVTLGHEASMAINALIINAEDITNAISELLPDPPIHYVSFSEWPPYDPSDTKAR